MTAKKSTDVKATTPRPRMTREGVVANAMRLVDREGGSCSAYI